MADFDMLPSAVSFVDDRLCYSGQKCRRIPEALIKLYGPKVQSLDLSYNELVSLRGLEGFPLLRELVLDNNQLSDSIVFPYLSDLHTLSLNKNNSMPYNFKNLSLSSTNNKLNEDQKNNITKLVDYLIFRKEKIQDVESLLLKISHNFPNLNYLSLLGNKACPNELSGEENDEEDYQRYRYYVLYHLPGLKFLDSNKVREVEKVEARRRGKFMNIIRPKCSNISENILNVSFTNSFTPLPKSIRAPDDHRGAYGKCRYRYSGKHSEGNRFISNNDL